MKGSKHLFRHGRGGQKKNYTQKKGNGRNTIKVVINSLVQRNLYCPRSSPLFQAKQNGSQVARGT